MSEDAPQSPRAAVAMLITRHEPAVLLMKRAEHPDDPWSGHWCFPGGLIEAGDPAPAAAARRELQEECGVDLAGRNPDLDLGIHLAGSHVDRPIPVAPILCILDAARPLRPDPREVADARWCPLAQLADHSRHEEARLAPADPDRLMPCVRIDDTPLWGFTYEVLMYWLERHHRPEA